MAGAALMPQQRFCLETSHAEKPFEVKTNMRILEHNKGMQSCWTLQMPSSVHPGKLYKCCCS